MARIFDASEGKKQSCGFNLPQHVTNKFQVAKHNTSDSCWVIVEQDGQKNVWDVTKFLPSHPGGSKIILKMAVSQQNPTYDTSDTL